MTNRQNIVAVTGASGFLGKVLISQLVAEGVTVVALTRRQFSCGPGVHSVQADIRDTVALAKAFSGVDAVFHLAAHVHDVGANDDSAQQEAVTLGGTVAVLDAAERSGVGRVILASSLAVFGEVGEELITEWHPCAPATHYGRAKLRAEQELVAFTTRTGSFGAAIRPAMIYGIGCPGNLPRMIRSIHSGWFPPIPEFGNRRSMVSVEDAASAMRLAWRRDVTGGRAFNVTDGAYYSTRELYDMIQEALGRKARGPVLPRAVFRVAARGGDLGRRVLRRRLPFDSQVLASLAQSACFDISRATSELGYRPTVSLRTLMPAIVDAAIRLS